MSSPTSECVADGEVVVELDSLPEELLLVCLARLSLTRGPERLPLVCNRFRSLTTSDVFEQTRHANGFSEILLVHGGRVCPDEGFHRSCYALIESGSNAKWVRLADNNVAKSIRDPRGPAGVLLKGSETLVGNELLQFGGYFCGNFGVYETDVHAYNIETNSWRIACRMPDEKSISSAPKSVSLPRERVVPREHSISPCVQIEAAACGTIRGMVIMAGGNGIEWHGGHLARNEAWKLDLEKAEWTPLPPLPYAVQGAVSFVLDDRYMYVIGGKGDDGTWAAESSDPRYTSGWFAHKNKCVGWTQMFDFESEEWSLKSDMPADIERLYYDGCLTSRGFVVIGPEGSSCEMIPLACYDPKADAWVRISNEFSGGWWEGPHLRGPVRVASFNGGIALVGDGGEVALMDSNFMWSGRLPPIPNMRNVEHAHIVSFPSHLLPLSLAKQLVAYSAVVDGPEQPNRYAQYGGAIKMMRDGQEGLRNVFSRAALSHEE